VSSEAKGAAFAQFRLNFGLAINSDTRCAGIQVIITQFGYLFGVLHTPPGRALSHLFLNLDNTLTCVVFRNTVYVAIIRTQHNTLDEIIGAFQAALAHTKLPSGPKVESGRALEAFPQHKEY
jgi:hypothetical protein